MERVMGIEPTSSAWKAEVLPLNYTRLSKKIFLVKPFSLHTKILTVLFNKTVRIFIPIMCVFPKEQLQHRSTVTLQQARLRHADSQSQRSEDGSVKIAILTTACHHQIPCLVEGVGFEPT